MATLMTAQLSMFDQAISLDTSSAISSPASAGGPFLPDLLDGPTIERSGPDLALASHSASRAKGRARKMPAISGPNSIASLLPPARLSSWESRLRLRLESHGSTECILTWKASATPAGRPLSRLVPSMRPIDEIVCGLWPTPTARLGDEQRGMPTADQGLKRFKSGRRNLEDAVAFSMWTTPSSRDWKDSPGMATTAINPDGSIRSRLDQLPRQAALYPTPTVNDSRGGRNSTSGRSDPHSKHHAGTTLCDLSFGEAQSGQLEPMEKPGALNPQFVSWLMGFPAEWASCAPLAMPSSRKSRPKSSAPISTAPQEV